MPATSEIHENGVVEETYTNGDGTEKIAAAMEVTPEKIENGAEKAAPQMIEIPTAKLQEIVMTDFIRESLDKVALSEGFHDYDINLDHGSSIGDGFVGIMLKAEIKEKDNSKKINVLAKIPPQNKARREAFKSMLLFEREIYMYTVYLPALVQFQQEHKISENAGFFNFPKVFYAENNPEKDDAILIMEDLRDRGYRMWSKYQPINFEHAKLLINSLGRLHGLSHALKAKRPELFEEFKKIDDLFFKMSLNDMEFFKYMEANVLNAINTLDEGDKDRERAMKLLNNLMEQVYKCVDPLYAEPYAVVTHGDCWMNNYLYHYDSRGAPESIVLIDWQISRYCSPVIDLVYFMFICSDQGLRVKHWDELLGIYHRSMRELLEQVGVDSMAQFPITALMRHLKKFGKFGVVMAIFVVPMLQMKGEDLPDMDFMAENMKDLDPAVMEEMMKKFANQQAPGVNIRLRDVVKDAIKYNYI